MISALAILAELSSADSCIRATYGDVLGEFAVVNLDEHLYSGLTYIAGWTAFRFNSLISSEINH
jgi:hypothetical protein